MAADMGVAKAALVSVRNKSPFYRGELITRAGSGITKLSDLKGKTFARVDPLSTSGWIIPMLTMRAAGIVPERDLKIVDAGSHDAVVAAVYNGDVDAGACYEDARTRIEKDHPDVMEKVIVLQITAPIPNDGVQFSPVVPKDMRDKIVKAILELVKTDEGKKAINVAYQWTDLVEKDDSFYDPFRQVLQAAGVKAEDLLKK
jgi:phosphonate transport system substrate-binding protein